MSFRFVNLHFAYCHKRETWDKVVCCNRWLIIFFLVVFPSFLLVDHSVVHCALYNLDFSPKCILIDSLCIRSKEKWPRLSNVVRASPTIPSYLTSHFVHFLLYLVNFIILCPTTLALYFLFPLKYSWFLKLGGWFLIWRKMETI